MGGKFERKKNVKKKTKIQDVHRFGLLATNIDLSTLKGWKRRGLD